MRLLNQWLVGVVILPSPLAAVLLITGTASSIDLTHVSVPGPVLRSDIQSAGLLMYVGGATVAATSAAMRRCKVKKLVIFVSLVVVLLSAAGGAGAQTPDEKTAIRQAAWDYVEGWYQADAARMDRALYKELAKRTILNAGNAEKFVNLTKPQMVEATREGGGHSRPAATWNIKVDVLDVYHEIATVRTECADYIDYLHLAKSEGKWQIVNVLWQDVVPEHKQVTVDPRILLSYAGEYELKPGVVFAVTVENEQLFVQPPQQAKMPVYPSSPTDFFLKGEPVEISFVKDAQGKVTQMVVHQGGNDMPAKKIK